MRPAALVPAVVAALGLVAGCASEPAPPEPFNVPPAVDTAPGVGGTPSPAPITLSPEQEELYGPRVELPGGLLLKQLGKVAQWGGPDDGDPNTWGIRLVLDKVEVDPGCDGDEFFTPSPGRDHRLVLSVRIETSRDYDPFRDGGSPKYYEWSTIGADGVSEAPPSSMQECRHGAEIPYDLRPSAKYRGEVNIETANPTGQLVLLDMFAWDYPA
ncbi:hypothetical protein [Pseudonocardia sp.]|uniref:hypothetical protein n=1 Tax=Pseudonocardia sp. TaxID=60912 RepID=UPI002629B8BE|nr:hypothetical protein [Pseudonocardia sp.]